MATIAAIFLLMLIEPLAVVAGIAIGAFSKKRAMVEPLALGGAIAIEILLILLLASHGASPVVLAARGFSMLLWAHLGHLFVRGYTPIQEDDRPRIDVIATDVWERFVDGLHMAWVNRNGRRRAKARQEAVVPVTIEPDPIPQIKELSDEGR